MCVPRSRDLIKPDIIYMNLIEKILKQEKADSTFNDHNYN